VQREFEVEARIRQLVVERASTRQKEEEAEGEGEGSMELRAHMRAIAMSLSTTHSRVADPPRASAPTTGEKALCL
jgi:hypothetical protein